MTRRSLVPRERIVRRDVEIRCITEWQPRAGEDGVSEQVIIEYHVDRSDGAVSVVLTPAQALAMVRADDAAMTRKRRDKKPSALMVVSVITWHNAIPGFVLPT